MREDNPATEGMNALSECINACGILCLKSSEARRDTFLDAVSWFIEAATLDDLHAVRTFGLSKDMIRDSARVVAKLRSAVLAWDGTDEPPLSLVTLAHEFLESVGMAQLGIQGSVDAAPG